MTKVDAPDLIGAAGHVQRLAIKHHELAPPALTHAERRLTIQPIDLLVIRMDALPAQQIMNAPVAETAPSMRQIDDPGPQRCRRRLLPQRTRRSVVLESPTSPQARRSEIVSSCAHLDHRLPLGLWG